MPFKDGISKLEANILSYIRIRKTPPTTSDVANKFNISTSSAYYHLSQLHSWRLIVGYIIKNKYHWYDIDKGDRGEYKNPPW